jgi:hypothetical protein
MLQYSYGKIANQFFQKPDWYRYYRSTMRLTGLNGEVISP